MLHISPFVGCVDHGFFTYQPNFYYALSRYNGYEVLGLWLNPNTALSSLIPWQHGMLQYIHLSPTTLGGHLKTGQSWTGQNRPVGEPPQARVLYRGRT